MSLLLQKLHSKIYFSLFHLWLPSTYSPLTDTYNFNRFIQALNVLKKCCFWIGIHVKIYGRAQSIPWSLSFSRHVLLWIKKKKEVTRRQVGWMRMGQKNLNLFFSKKGFMCWDVDMKKLNVAYYRLWSLTFVIFLNFLHYIIIVYMSGD